MACVNQITTVKLTSVIRNATMVVRKTYQPIDPIGPDFPTDGPPKGRTGPPTPPRGASRSLPNASPFMLSQNGLAKADLLVMHNSRLTAGGRDPGRAREPAKCPLHQGDVRFIWRYRKHPTGQEGPNHDRRPHARLRPLRPLARRSRCVLWGKPQIRPCDPARFGADWRFGAPGRRGRPLHRQE